MCKKLSFSEAVSKLRGGQSVDAQQLSELDWNQLALHYAIEPASWLDSAGCPQYLPQLIPRLP
jgi:hypothetical protein